MSIKLIVKTPKDYESSGNFALLGVSQDGTNAYREHEFNLGTRPDVMVRDVVRHDGMSGAQAMRG